MFKKTLVALAIASMAGSAAAATITVTGASDADKGAIVSAEGKAISTKIAQASIVVALEAEYTQNDTVTLSFDGVSILKDFVFVDSINVAAAGASGGVKGITLGKISQNDTSVTYRVTAIDESAGEVTTKGISLTFTGAAAAALDFDAASLSNKATVTYKATTNNGLDLDNGNHKTRPLFTVASELSSAVATKFDGTVDVDAQRLAFDNTGANQAEDTVAPTLTLTAAELLPITLDADKVVYQVNGDFAFLDTDADTDGIQTSKVTVTNIVADSLVVEADKISFKVADDAALPVVTVDVSGTETDDSSNPIADAPIATQDFTITTTLDYSIGGETKEGFVVASSLDAGEWDLNGAVVHVPFMPFRTGYSPIVNVSNTSGQDGDIEVLVYAKNDAAWVKPESYMLDVSAKALAQTDITAALKATGIQGDVAFDIIVNAPKKDIEVNALFYRDGDRAVINTVKQP